MVVRTIKTNLREAEEILRYKRHIFRSDKIEIKAGDIIQFLVMKQAKPVLHSIDAKSYIVTSVDDYLTAPLIKGARLIGIKEV